MTHPDVDRARQIVQDQAQAAFKRLREEDMPMPTHRLPFVYDSHLYVTPRGLKDALTDGATRRHQELLDQRTEHHEEQMDQLAEQTDLLREILDGMRWWRGGLKVIHETLLEILQETREQGVITARDIAELATGRVETTQGEGCDEDTMFKAGDALRDYGLDPTQAIGALTAMQNAGILFRERTDDQGDII